MSRFTPSTKIAKAVFLQSPNRKVPACAHCLQSEFSVRSNRRAKKKPHQLGLSPRMNCAVCAPHLKFRSLLLRRVQFSSPPLDLAFCMVMVPPRQRTANLRLLTANEQNSRNARVSSVQLGGWSS